MLHFTVRLVLVVVFRQYFFGPRPHLGAASCSGYSSVAGPLDPPSLLGNDGNNESYTI
jgi:hypothetical protein